MMINPTFEAQHVSQKVCSRALGKRSVLASGTIATSGTDIRENRQRAMLKLVRSWKRRSFSRI